MAFKSQAQKAKFEQMLKEGKISKEDFAKWAEGTPEKLPERITILRPAKPKK